jgi:hypothetical protein
LFSDEINHAILLLLTLILENAQEFVITLATATRVEAISGNFKINS